MKRANNACSGLGGGPGKNGGVQAKAFSVSWVGPPTKPLTRAVGLPSSKIEDERHMETGRQALVLFYAFFWAAALSVTGRYQPFDTPSMFQQRRARYRFIVSLLILNGLPIALFVFLYLFVIPNDDRLVSIVAAAIASFSTFGFHRILHSIIASERLYHWFYTSEEITEVRDRGKFHQPQTFSAHFIPGLLYILVSVSLARLILWLAR